MSAPVIDATVFSPEAYAELVRDLRARGYEFCSYSEANRTARHVIMRHDVDFSLDAARIMAEQERALGFASTYFVLMRSEFYNPLSAKGLRALEQITECGHTIGLHFDAALYPNDPTALEAAATRECTLLEAVVGRAVSVLSLHRPAAKCIGEAERIADRLNAYGPQFVRDIGYCSDSRGAWHHGNVFEHRAVLEGRALQLLVHPFWWQAPPMAPEERLRTFLEERHDLLDRELAHHCTVHKSRK